MVGVEGNEVPAEARQVFGRELRSWLSALGLLSATFFGSVTITNIFRTTFDIELAPFFEPVFDSFRQWSHWALDVAIFGWLGFLLDSLSSLAALMAERLFGFDLQVPRVAVPALWKDASIVSFLLLRSQNAALNLASPVSLHRMTAEEKQEWRDVRAKGSTVGRALETILWFGVMTIFHIASWVAWPLRRLLGTGIGKLFRDTVGGALQLGMLYLAHDVVVAMNTAYSHSRFARGHRRFVALMGLSLVAAACASIVFLFINGALSPSAISGEISEPV